jgi:DNA-binding transcriptional LysR family regulator
VFDWNDARYFLAVARLGSLSRAARQLGVQQSTAGRRIAALEAALGARLFERMPEGLSPTAAGQLFLTCAERIEDEVLSAERQLAGKEGRATGRVRITAPQALGFELLVPLLLRLKAEQPGIVVELVADNAPLDLSRRHADLALRLAMPTQRRLVARRLGVVVDALYASREYLALAGPVRSGALANHSFIDFDESFVRRDTAVWLSERLLGARCALVVNGTHGILSAVRAGFGIGLLPCWLAEGEPRLVRVLAEDEIEHELWLVVHPDLRRAGRIRAVSDFLVRELLRLRPLLAGRSTAAPAVRKGRRSSTRRPI